MVVPGLGVRYAALSSGLGSGAVRSREDDP